MVGSGTICLLFEQRSLHRAVCGPSPGPKDMSYIVRVQVLKAFSESRQRVSPRTPVTRPAGPNEQIVPVTPVMCAAPDWENLVHRAEGSEPPREPRREVLSVEATPSLISIEPVLCGL